MPFLAYIHAEQPDKRPDKPPWEPNWRVWRWIAGAVLATFAAAHADGAAQALLVLIAFVLVCLAAEAALPRGDGLRQWRQ